MRRLLFGGVVLLCMGWAAEAQAGCCPRTPVRTAVGAVLDRAQLRTDARRVLERRPVRRALGALVCPRCG